jgi:hypothetical protein
MAIEGVEWKRLSLDPVERGKYRQVQHRRRVVFEWARRLARSGIAPNMDEVIDAYERGDWSTLERWQRAYKPLEGETDGPE